MRSVLPSAKTTPSCGEVVDVALGDHVAVRQVMEHLGVHDRM